MRMLKKGLAMHRADGARTCGPDYGIWVDRKHFARPLTMQQRVRGLEPGRDAHRTPALQDLDHLRDSGHGIELIGEGVQRVQRLAPLEHAEDAPLFALA